MVFYNRLKSKRRSWMSLWLKRKCGGNKDLEYFGYKMETKTPSFSI